jgi:hypothetical protein
LSVPVVAGFLSSTEWNPVITQGADGTIKHSGYFYRDVVRANALPPRS